MPTKVKVLTGLMLIGAGCSLKGEAGSPAPSWMPLAIYLVAALAVNPSSLAVRPAHGSLGARRHSLPSRRVTGPAVLELPLEEVA
jgi:hypothetical protein